MVGLVEENGFWVPARMMDNDAVSGFHLLSDPQ